MREKARRTRRVRWLAALLGAAAVLFAVPAVTLAVEGDDVITVPAEGLAVNRGTVYGISEKWYEDQLDGADSGNFRLKVEIPAEVDGVLITSIGKDAFRDSYTSDKSSYGAVNSHDNEGWNFSIVEADFTKATNLTTIKSQAAMYVPLTGVLDLSKTKVSTIEKSAFSGCTGLTGVVLPSTLTALGDSSSGSVFNGCTGLEYIRVAGGDESATFELPGSLGTIGRQTFKKCFAEKVAARVTIPAGVETIGLEAFYTDRVKQIVVKREGDGRDSNYKGYDSRAFKTGSDDYLIVFPDYTSYQDYSLNVKPTTNAIRRAMACPMTLKFKANGAEVKTEQKLRYQSIKYTPIEGTEFWEIDDDYALPEAGNNEMPEKPGYKVGAWTLDGEELTTSSVLNTNTTSPVAEMGYVFLEPEISFTVDGVVQENSRLVVPYDGVTSHSAGVKVTHPLTLDEQGDENNYVYFEYCWWDEYDDGESSTVNGPRSVEEPELFSTSENGTPNRVKTTEPEIPISKLDHARDDGSQYMVEVYGYRVLNGEEPEFFYKSHHNFIDFGGDTDAEATVDRSYVFSVTVDDISDKVISVTPADITVYTGGDAYEGVVDGTGGYSQSVSGLPEPGFRVELPDELATVDVSYLTFKERGGSKTWHFEPYGKGSTDVFRLVPAESQEAVRVQFKDADGNVVVSDKFDPGQSVNRTLEMSLYKGEVGDIEVTYDGATYPVDSSVVGTLTVRGTKAPTYAAVGGSATAGEPALSAPDGTTYAINGGNVVLDDTSGVALLFDEIIDVDGGERSEALNTRAEGVLGEGWNTQLRYLDLVDTNNGNAWVAASEPVTVSWPVPDGVDASGVDFRVLHFEGVHRSLGADQILEEIKSCDVEEIMATVSGGYVTFQVKSSGFSPFALAWKTDEPDTPVTPPVTKYYEITASAGEGGTISPSGTHSYAAGSDVTFTIAPDEGYTVGDVTVDGVSYRQLGSYTFEDLDDDHTISVTFMRGSDPTSPDETGVSDWLNASDHVAYLHGYGDGSGKFGPENPMTRAEVAQMFYNLLLDKSMGDRAVSFEDVPEGAYYAEAVRVLASRGILNGTGPTTFEPDRAITRAEFVAIAMRFSNGDFEGDNPYVDVPEDAWYRDYVVGATSFGWIYGYQDGSHRFGPDDTITRGQATMVTNRMLWRSCDTVWATEHLDELRTFVDLGRGHYAFFDVVEATNAHDFERVGDTRFEDWTGLRE